MASGKLYLFDVTRAGGAVAKGEYSASSPICCGAAAIFFFFRPGPSRLPDALLPRPQPVSWPPPGTKGKKLVVGCEDGTLVTLNHDLSAPAAFPACTALHCPAVTTHKFLKDVAPAGAARGCFGVRLA